MDIRKASGDVEVFSPHKLTAYLQSIGVREADNEKIIADVTEIVDTQVVDTTSDLRKIVARLLEELDNGVKLRARYLLKEAIYALGPAGFNFEVFISRLLQQQGFSTQVGVIIEGDCVPHEVDVYAQKDGEYHFIECKFHNKEGIKSDLVTSLYVSSRFEDLKAANDNPETCRGWLATNTKMTDTGLKFARCHNIQILSLTKPQGNSISDLVFRHNLFPITSLQTLKDHHQQLITQGKILIKDIQPQLQSGQLLHLPEAILEEVRSEVEGIIG